MEEPLRAQARQFVNALTTGANVISDARRGLSVVRALAAADQSMAQGGMPVALEP